MFWLKTLECCLAGSWTSVPGRLKEYPCIYCHPSSLQFWDSIKFPPVSQSLPCCQGDRCCGCVRQELSLMAKMAFSLMAKMAFFLDGQKDFSLFFPQVMAFFSGHSSVKPSSVDCTAKSCPMDRYSNHCCGAFKLLHGYLQKAFLLPLWWMPPLPGPWVLVGSPFLAALWWCRILSIF